MIITVETARCVLEDFCPNGVDYAGKFVWHVVTLHADRGKGLASRVMRKACEWADAHGHDLWLQVVPDDEDEGLDRAALTAWYERLGFVRRGPYMRRAARVAATII
jgi:GNAT superfamily N-acetyltransferase